MKIYEAFNRQIGVVAAAIKQELAYRFESFTAILGALLMMALLYYLWTAIYHNATSIEMSYPALITYVCLGQAFSFARPGQRRIITRIGGGIRSGDVLIDLVRPTDYQLLTFSDTLGAYVVETLLVSLPSYLLAFLFFGINPPASPQAALGFIVSLFGAFFLVCSVDFLIGLMAFWTYSIWGLAYAKIAVLDILAGTMVPLSLFPDWLRGIALALPFQGMAYTPLAIYVGAIQGSAIWTSILNQFAWGVGLVLLTRLIWLKAKQRMEIQGG
ncbi:MAG: ABC-2 family transporter protein [Chloroflexi bacterium]|nr:ABC-2 family transporter protein [Chloroflexota bacterium]